MAFLNVGFNWDPDLAQDLADMNVNYKYGVVIRTVYGSTVPSSPDELLTNNPLKTARPPARLPRVSDEQFKQCVATLNHQGIGINYTINASCIPLPDVLDSNGEFIPEVSDWVGRISSYIDRFTVAHPAIVHALDACCNVPVELSIIMEVRSLGQLEWISRNWPNVKSFCLPLWRNRDFRFLDRLYDLTSSDYTIPKPEILVNEFCSIGGQMCSGLYRQSCYMSHSHGYFNEAGNYPMTHCTASRWNNPASWIMANFVLPQWMRIYEGHGILRFKVSGRTHPSEYIRDIVRCYMAREYQGNLLGLWAQLESIWKGAEGQEEAIQKLDIPTDLLDSIENRAFLEFFENQPHNCMERGCGVGCFHCVSVFEKIMAYEEARKELKDGQHVEVEETSEGGE